MLSIEAHILMVLINMFVMSYIFINMYLYLYDQNVIYCLQINLNLRDTAIFISISIPIQTIVFFRGNYIRIFGAIQQFTINIYNMKMPLFIS